MKASPLGLSLPNLHAKFSSECNRLGAVGGEMGTRQARRVASIRGPPAEEAGRKAVAALPAGLPTSPQCFPTQQPTGHRH